MSYNATEMFERGKTFYGDATPNTSDYGGINLEGQTRVFPNRDPVTLVLRRGGGDVTCMCVRNVSGIALLPKYAVAWKAGFRHRRVDGYVIAPSAEVAGIVDEFLPAGGVQNGDLFWIARKGMTLGLTNTAASALSGTFSEGSGLIGLTAAASTAGTDCGRLGYILDSATLTGAGVIALVMNRVGRALTAKTSANTNTDVLVALDLI
jgi:hypothetical protein